MFIEISYIHAFFRRVGLILPIKLEGFSHTGNYRTENQDAFEHDDHLVVIADGMGGHTDGREAAINVCRKIVQLAAVRNLDEPISRKLLESWLDHTNRFLIEILPGSGSTCSILVFNLGNFFISWVGDTRVYISRGGRVQLLTTDQNLATTSGNGLNAHILTNHIGKRKLAPPGFITGKLLHNDRFILASDGAYDGNEEYIFSSFSADNKSDQIAALLESKISQSDPKDNYTLLIASSKNG